MKSILKIALVSSLLLGVACYASDASSTTTTTPTATTGSQVTAGKAFKDMTPEEKKQLKEALKKEWDSLSPSQKAQLRKDVQGKWKSMTPDEKKAAIEKVKNAVDSNSGSSAQ